MCPTARSLPPSDLALSAFEQHVQRANLTEDHVLFFPKYGKPPPAAGLALRPCALPQPDPCLGLQVSARPQTSSTS